MKPQTNDQLIVEFHKKMLGEHPDITLEQAKDICYGPWRFLKTEMENGNLEEVRFKYFGTFQVYPGRAKNMLINLKARFRFNKIARVEYYRIKDMLDKFMKKNEEN